MGKYHISLMNKKIIKGAVLGGLSLLLGLGSYFIHPNHSKVLWQKSKPEFLAPYEEARATESQRLVDWLMQIQEDRNFDKQETDEEYIEGSFNAYRANVPSLAEADIIILGDFHGKMDMSLDLVLNRLTRKQDPVLIEQSSDSFSELDLTVFEQLDRENPYDISNASLTELMDSMQFLLKQIELGDMQHNLLSNLIDSRNFGVSLVGGKKGRIIGIDVEEETKTQTIYSIIQSSLLPVIQYHLSTGDQLHPFEQWLLETDLGIVQSGDSPESIVDSINNYLTTLPSRSDIHYQRHREIVDKIVDHATNLEEGEQAKLVIGSTHISEFPEYSLLDNLEKKRVGYVAFVPDEDRINDGLDSALETETTPEKLDRLNAEYLKQLIEVNYIHFKVESGIAPFQGSLEGLSDRILEYTKSFRN